MPDAATAPSLDEARVYIYVEGEVFDFWTDYACSSDLLDASDGFFFHAPAVTADTKELDGRGLYPGQRCHVLVKTPKLPTPVLQMTGRLEDVEMKEGAHGTVVTAHGRDHLAPIVDSDVMPSIALEDVTFADVIRRVLLAPRPGLSTGYFSAKDLVIDNDANRALLTGKPSHAATLSEGAPKAPETLKVDQARPHAGETIFQFLQRHAIRFGLLVWGTADGKIVFSRPNYAQKPLYSLRARRGLAGADNNVESIGRRRSIRGRPSEVRVYGHAHGSRWYASAVHAIATDDELGKAGVYALLTVHDNNARTNAEAMQRARLELSRRRQNADVVHVEVAGHAAGDGTIWSIDTMADLAWESAGIVEARYVARRTFLKSGGKSTTQLELLPKHAIALGDR